MPHQHALLPQLQCLEADTRLPATVAVRRVDMSITTADVASNTLCFTIISNHHICIYSLTFLIRKSVLEMLRSRDRQSCRNRYVSISILWDMVC